MFTYSISVSSTLSEIIKKTWESGSQILQNSGETPVWLGDETVSADGSTPSLQLAPGATLALPQGGAVLCAVVASGTSTLTAVELGRAS